jgi:outer membrane protein with beta-barrel domain
MSIQKILSTMALVAAAAAVARPAAAQQWTDRGYMNVSFGVQAPSRTLTTNTTFDIYGEQASQTATQDVGGGAFFDIAGGYKVWRNLAAGVGLTFVGSKADLAVAAQIPDPTFFDRLRPVSTTLTGAKYRETAVHLTATWMMPMTEEFDIAFQFGPTIFLVSQDIPGTLQVAEPGPTITSAELVKDDHTAVGVHFGVDATYQFRPRLGAGVLMRYSIGSVDIAGSTDSLKVGGFNIGAGVRVRF